MKPAGVCAAAGVEAVLDLHGERVGAGVQEARDVDALGLLPGVLVVVAQGLGVDHLRAVDEDHGLVVDGEEEAAPRRARSARVTVARR